MQAIEEYKPELAGVLPQDEYFRLTRSLQNSGLAHRLLKIFSDIPLDAGGDLFGKIYEYFLANFAMSEGQGGGEFFTPRSVVKLMVEIIEPHGGKVFDPACGSGGMFVQSAEFIAAHRGDHAAKGKTGDSIYVYGQEKTLETVKLAKMNLAVNGLHGSVMQANTYVEDPHGSLGQFDYPLVYLYHWLKLGKPHFESLSGGSTFAELTKGTFKRMEILAPPHALVQQFQQLVSPLFKSIETHLKANTSLKAIRDDLLPRLISGKLAVDALNIRFPPGMAPPAP